MSGYVVTEWRSGFSAWHGKLEWVEARETVKSLDDARTAVGEVAARNGADPGKAVHAVLPKHGPMGGEVSLAGGTTITVWEA